MKELFKITKERLRNHLHYGKWYYIGAIVAAVVIINIALNVTKPDYPRESRVSIMIYGGVAEQSVVEKWESDMLNLLPENQREVEIVTTVNAEGSMEMIIVARTVASDDDIIILSSDAIENYASQGMFMPLDELITRDKIKELVKDDDLTKYEMFVEGAEKDQIYYLPLSQVEGFDEIGLYGDSLCIGVLLNSPNSENAAICLEYLMTR